LAQQTHSNLHLWVILADLATVRTRLGDEHRAAESRKQARAIVEKIADSLSEVGLRESFLDRPQVRALLA